MMLISVCDFPWWLMWLLPLLGFLLGWLLGQAPKNRRIAELEADLDTCRSARTSLKAEFDGLNSNYDGLQGEHNLLNNRFNELSSNYNTLSAKHKPKDKPKKEKPAVVKESKEIKLSPNKGDLNYDLHAKLKNTNLQIIEGIGPKMEELLKNNGVNNWEDLSKHNGKSLRSLLDNVSPTKYKIIDPSTWGEQAAFAAHGKWNVLTDFQRNLDTGKTDTMGNTDAKVEKVLIRLGFFKKWKKDDLKAIEGIGPKIEGLFHAAGIKTWKGLSESSVSRLKGILDEAGDRYRLADPGTWPEQARMAHEGLWDKLKEYQDFLQGGK